MPHNPVLFISLGTTQAIVPEAFLVCGRKLTAVHVLTTEQTGVALIKQFFQTHAPQVHLTISRVAHFHQLTTPEDHFRFEETLYRWILDAGTPLDQRYICLAGGFKTMSAAMQKAAAVLGAQDVFHVIADEYIKDNGRSRPPSSIAEILDAADHNHLHRISLGSETGWPQLRSLPAKDFPLQKSQNQDGDWTLHAPDDKFRQHLTEIVNRSHNIAGAWEQLPQLPFPLLAARPQQDLDWLHEPLQPESDTHWVQNLPKIELHCHLGGFATEGELLQQVRAQASNPSKLPPLNNLCLPPGWPLPASNISLQNYMQLGNNNGSTLLKDPGCLRGQCQLLYQHLRRQNIIYAEIRCSPANYATKDRSPWQVLCDIRNAFQKEMEQSPGCHVNLILIATRRSGGDFRAAISRHLALAVTAAEHWTDPNQCRVVGVDLAGYEDKETRAHYFREEFIGIHRCGLALTVHAGENDDAEGIWRAVFDLNARRLGHALHLYNSPELMRSIAARGIGLEMCPYANYQIHPYRIPGTQDRPKQRRDTYPLMQYLNEGLRVTVNTDNIGISRADLTQNLLLAARLCPTLTRLDLLQLQRHALDIAFVSPAHRVDLLRQFQKLLEPPQT